MQVDCTPQGGESASGATMADWALGYGGMGVAVFPVHTPLNTLGACSCNKAECSDAGKHPRTARGWKDASTDERQIRAWWEQWPEANIGLATGKISNAFGFDIDDGDEGLAEVARYGGLPEGPRARTGRGLHAYFVWPGFAVPNGVKKSGTWGRAFAHCDLRGDGGYTILPPSMHKSGVRYGWIGDCPTSVGDFPAAPDWLLDKITACVEERAEKARWARESVGKGGGDGSFDAALAERILDKYIRMVMEDGNERNISGFHMAEQLRDNGVPYQAAFPYMRRYQQAVEHLKDHPYSWDEATRSTDSAYQGRAPREPWATHGGEDGEGIGRWGALRYAEEYGREMRYVPVHKRWFVWTGAYWQHDRVEAHLRRGIELVGKLYAEAGDPARQDTGTKRKAAQRRVGKLDTAGGIRGMVGLAAACAEIAAPAEAFDRDPWLATVANGTLDLRLDRSPDNGASALLRPHAQADLLTRRLGKGRAGIAYQPTAVCPQWEAFLRRIFVQADGVTPDDELIGYLQRWCGYVLTGMVTEQMLLVCHGGGQNGKRTFVQAIEEVLGEYAGTISIETLLAQYFEGNAGPAELAKLDGARFVQCGENDAGRALNEARVKLLTGNDPIPARHLRGDPFSYEPQFKLLLHTNHKPRIRGQDKGIWRRVKLIPFTVTIPEGERDPLYFEHHLRAELEGILSWMVRGCLDWQRGGLGEPRTVTQATEGYRSAEDVVRQFVDESLIVEEGVQELQKTAYTLFVDDCRRQGIRPIPSSQAFAERVRDITGCESKGTNKGQAFVGLRLRLSSDEGTADGADEGEERRGYVSF